MPSTRRSPAICAFAVASLLLVTGCGGGPTAPTGDPDYVGYIVSIGATNAFVKALDDECGIVLQLTKDTYYGVGDRKAARADLSAALLASVWVTGPILESCPAQGTAAAITVD